jgi:diguanylate cyclase (GGDEF)-like protein/PAS domain S-box-containing protein
MRVGDDRVSARDLDRVSAFWDTLTNHQDDAGQVLDVIVRYVSAVVGEACVLTMVTDEGQVLTPVATYHPDPDVHTFIREVLAATPYRVDSGIAGSVAASGTPIILNGIANDALPLREHGEAFQRRHPIKALMIVPLVAGGEVIGTLGAVRIESDEQYSDTDLRTFEALAERAAIALAASRSRPRALDVAQYKAVFEHSIDGVLFTAPDGRVLAANPAACRILGRSEVAMCELGRGGLVVADDPRTRAALEQRRRAGHVRAEVPMRHASGEIIVVDISSTVYIDADGEQRSIVVFRDVSDRIAERERITQLARENEEKAMTDELSGCLNRRGFMLAVRRLLAFADRQREEVQLLYLDLDELKHVNDSEGHAAGDAAIASVGAAIGEVVRQVDVAGRLGGDEFALALYGASPSEATAVVERIRWRLVEMAEGPSPTFSVGIAARPAGSEIPFEELLAQADRAMYGAKWGGRGG